MLDPDAIVVIVTGYDNMECTRQALDYGAFRFLTKPVKMAEFKSVVELGLLERKKLYHTTTSEKLVRMKDKVNTNIELREKLFHKLQSFLLQIEEKKPSYVEIGGPGSKDKIWGKFFSSFKPIPLETVFTQDEINIMILSILSDKQLESLLQNKSIRCNFEFKKNDVKYRYRFNIYFEMDELVIGIKTTRRTLVNIDNFKLTSNIINTVTFKNENSGIVIISGPPGSGKSSLIDSIVNINNSYLSGNIFIIADSLEYYHESKNSVVRHQELFRDVNQVSEALEQCQNYNPNLVVIEDIINQEILDGMIKLADTGCLVIATLKNKSVIEVIYKLLTFYSTTEHNILRKHLARTLSSIICLQLLPSSQKKIIPVNEILVNTSQVATIISSGNIDELYEVVQRSKKAGMHTLEQDLVHTVRAGQLSSETALEYANNQQLLKNMLQYS